MMERLQGGKRLREMRGAEQPRPLVSIVTVVFNGADSIERTIQSVLGQGRNDLEYIIIDGGSTDGTVEILRRYEANLDLWVSERDDGIYDAMNRGIALCTGQWVGLINADDAYTSGALGIAMDAVASRPDINIVHGDILISYGNGNGKVKRARRSGFLLKYWEMVLNHPSFFVRRSYYDGRAFDPKFRVGGDHHWTLRAWRENPRQFLYLPVVLAHFSAGGASMAQPLGRALAEGDRIGADLGFSSLERLMGKVVRIVLYWPSQLKVWFNACVAPLTRFRDP